MNMKKIVRVLVYSVLIALITVPLLIGGYKEFGVVGFFMNYQGYAFYRIWQAHRTLALISLGSSAVLLSLIHI